MPTSEATCCRTRSSTGPFTAGPDTAGPNSPGLAPDPLRSDRPTLNRRSLDPSRCDWLDQIHLRLDAHRLNAHRLKPAQTRRAQLQPTRSDRPTLIQLSLNTFRCGLAQPQSVQMRLAQASIRQMRLAQPNPATGSTRTGSSHSPGRLGRLRMPARCLRGRLLSQGLGRMPDLIRSEPLASGQRLARS